MEPIIEKYTLEQYILLTQMLNYSVRGYQCIDVGFNNDSMGEVIDPEGYYYGLPSELGILICKHKK